MHENKLTIGSNMRWTSNRMMLPEHVEALRQRKIDQSKVDKPALDEQELQEIGIVVMDSLNYKLDVTVEYWTDGFFQNVVGSVDFVDMQQKRIRVRIEGERLYIPIDCLMSVERI